MQLLAVKDKYKPVHGSAFTYVVIQYTLSSLDYVEHIGRSQNISIQSISIYLWFYYIDI